MSFIHPYFLDGKTLLSREAKGLAQGLTTKSVAKWICKPISVSRPGMFL